MDIKQIKSGGFLEPDKKLILKSPKNTILQFLLLNFDNSKSKLVRKSQKSLEQELYNQSISPETIKYLELKNSRVSG